MNILLGATTIALTLAVSVAWGNDLRLERPMVGYEHSGPRLNNTVVRQAAGSRAMRPTVAMANKAATYSLAWEGVRVMGTVETLELTVAPTVVSPLESYLVQVFITNPDASVYTPYSEGYRLGDFSFYPMPRVGENRTFVLPVSDEVVTTDGKMNLLIKLISAHPEARLEHSAIEVLNAQILD